MKDIITIEINGKREHLGYVEINTPNEYLLVNNKDSILNNRIFTEFIDEIFWLTVNDLAHEADGKIDNVYVTFVNNDDELICSIVLDRLRPRRGRYRMRVVDWQINGHIFKYIAE